MNMKEWAKNEIELFSKANTKVDSEFNYAESCAESALKAFDSVFDNDNTGYSFNNVKELFCRLIDGKPLTPIEDSCDEWEFFKEDKCNNSIFRAKRMSGLFKFVDNKTGKVTYKDINRVVIYDKKTKTYSYNETELFKEQIPEITMPYLPENDPYYICVSYCSADNPEILFIKTPNGEFIF